MKYPILSLLAATTLAQGKLPEDVQSSITKAAASLGETMEKYYGGEEKNFPPLLKKLNSLGFGNPPLDPPPWYQAHEESETDEKQKDREAEMKTRLKTIGKFEVESIVKLDLDKDRNLTKEEINTALTAYLTEVLEDRMSVDQDKDGKLSQKEYCLMVPARGEIDPKDGMDWHQRGHFQSDDANKDGVIDQSELLGHEVKGQLMLALRVQAVHRLKDADQDDDHKVTQKELESLWLESLDLSEAYPAIYWFSAEKLNQLK